MLAWLLAGTLIGEGEEEDGRRLADSELHYDSVP